MSAPRCRQCGFPTDDARIQIHKDCEPVEAYERNYAALRFSADEKALRWHANHNGAGMARAIRRIRLDRRLEAVTAEART